MAEAAPRLDGRAHDDELGPVVVGDLGDLLPEPACARPDDHASDAHAVRVGDRRRLVEVLTQLREIEVRVERQLLLDEERRHEDDARSAICREPAREVEGVLCLSETEQRDDDVAITDCRGSPGEPAQLSAGGKPQPHRRRWYGTLVRMTLGSNSSIRLM